MKLVINGEELEIKSVESLEELITRLKLDKSRIATELNKQVVRKAEYPNTPLADGDQLEIVTFVGGG